jgi:hypothetical protein
MDEYTTFTDEQLDDATFVLVQVNVDGTPGFITVAQLSALIDALP